MSIPVPHEFRLEVAQKFSDRVVKYADSGNKKINVDAFAWANSDKFLRVTALVMLSISDSTCELEPLKHHSMPWNSFSTTQQIQLKQWLLDLYFGSGQYVAMQSEIGGYFSEYVNSSKEKALREQLEIEQTFTQEKVRAA